MTRTPTSAHRHCRRRGYVLVVTLGLLVLAATLLVSIGRAAVDHALRARRAEADLQQRWGVVSARIAILPGADDTLARLEQDLHRPIPVYRTTVRLGDTDVALILSDEQAKANINALIATAGKGPAETRIRDAVSGSGLTNAVLIRPASLPPAARVDALPRWVDGFGQVFDAAGPEQLTQVSEACPAEVVTCWGDGALNVMRASRASLALSGGSALNGVTVNRLLKERDAAFAPLDQARNSLMPRTTDATPRRFGDAVSALLDRARVEPNARGRLALTSRSACHSLWVITGRGDARRYTLFVSDQSNPADRQIRAFAW